MKYSAAVITVSDKGARGERHDTSGPMLQKLLEKRGFDVKYTNIIPDDMIIIEDELMLCADEYDINLVLTTGGTGFAQRDVTPEATMNVIDREAEGIPEMMRAESAKVTNRACLSRAKAGIRGRTLIINLPGSEKAAKENFEAIADSLEHGMQMLLSTGSADCAEPYAADGREKENINSGKAGKISRLFQSKAYNQHNEGSGSQLFFDLSNDPDFKSSSDAISDTNENQPLHDEGNSEGTIGSSIHGAGRQFAQFDLSNSPAADESVHASNLTDLFANKEYIPVPEDALVSGQILNGKKIPPRVDEWLRDAKRSEFAHKCGMYLTHNGVVREDARAKVREGDVNAKPVTGMHFGYDEKAVKDAIEKAYQMPGIYYVKVWLNQGELDPGDDIMFVLIGGDIRPNVIRALEDLVGIIKTSCVEEVEQY